VTKKTHGECYCQQSSAQDYRRIIDTFKAKQFQTATDECPVFLAHRSDDTTVLFLGGSAAQALGLTKIYVELLEDAAALNPA